MKIYQLPMFYFLFSILTTAAHAAYYFEDGFESGDLMSTNTQGAEWAGRTFQDHGAYVFNSQGIVWRAGKKQDPPLTSISGTDKYDFVKDSNSVWAAKSGSHSLRFIYNKNLTSAQRNFSFGAALPEVWIKYWIRVPSNYYHYTSPDGSQSNVGKKWFALYQDGYSSQGVGSTIIWGLGPKPSPGKSSGLVVNWSPGCYTVTGKWSPPAPCLSAKHDKNTVPFIRVPDDKTTPPGDQSNGPNDRGRWMQVILHAKIESSDGASDGLFQTYRRWEDEADFSLVEQRLNVSLHSGKSKGSHGWSKMYFLGASNGLSDGYPEQMEWAIDDFSVSDQKPAELSGDVKALAKPPSQFKRKLEP